MADTVQMRLNLVPFWTEGFGAIPFDGLILAHSNEAEWLSFKNNRNNEAFLDRIYIVKVPYSLRVSDEIHIYECGI